jgi:Lipid A 3-O-deacylase (PagL)
MPKKLLVFIFVFITAITSAQSSKHEIVVGVNYGFGSEIRNKEYTYTNHFYKLELIYTLRKTKNFIYQILLQPEVNFATHQLKNFYFVKPSEPDFLEKRATYTQLKEIHEYVFGVGFLVRKPISESVSIYVLGSVGPMITDTETERLTKGFAFSDVLSLGISIKTKHLIFDIRPSLRHNSNAGIQGSNAGFNTKNIEFGIAFPLRN